MKSIIDQFLPQLKSNNLTWTEFVNTLLDFDIEIVTVTPIQVTGRNQKDTLKLSVEFSDRASANSTNLEF